MLEFDVMALMEKAGPVLALLGYFVWKDKTFTGRTLELMGKIEALLESQRKGAA